MKVIAAALALMLCACAQAPAPAAPPRLAMPGLATEPCALYRLPQGATLADLETGFARRGEDLSLCDQKRRLAVETAAAEQALQAAWPAAPKSGFRWFSRGTSGGAAASHP